MNSNEYLIVTDPSDSGGVSVDNSIHQIPYRVSITPILSQKFIHPDMFRIITYLNISAPFIEQFYVTYNSTRLQGYYISLRELQIQITSSMLLCINCFLLRVNCFFIFDMFCVSSCLIARF